MKTEPIVAARVELSADGVPRGTEYDDIYHPAGGAVAQAQHVFLAGNGLPQRWSGRDRFAVLETGFGLGNNFLATWRAWRDDPQACTRLHFISIEKHPPCRDTLRTVPREADLQPLVDELVDAWPPLTCNLHRLSFSQGRVQLLIALGDVLAWLPEITASVDAFYLDGFAPAKNPWMWQPRLFKAMARMAAPGATVATWSAASAVREGLTAAGFAVRKAPGAHGKRDITLARFDPRFTPRRAPARIAAPTPTERRAVIVGAGLAGCAAAWALAEQGWQCTVLDRHADPAREASGNPAGLFHGIVNLQDGAHARFNRAAALEAQRIIGGALHGGHVQGDLHGALRLETSGLDAARMQARIDHLGLPPDYVAALDAEQASAIAGLRLDHPAWFYPGGGWVRPRQLATHFLREAGSAVTWRGGIEVTSLRRDGEPWQLLDAHGRVIDEAAAVVLANAGDAMRLLCRPAWPLEPVRGQLSMLDANAVPWLPRIPVAGTGYLLPAVDGHAIFGATVAPNDFDESCREDDHQHNLSQLAQLSGRTLTPSREALRGRVGWRWSADDRLPLVGAVPDERAAAASARLDQARMVPRHPGLFVLTGLGSRGITWCALCAQVLAASMSGAPLPLESSLLDAIDPARFIVRRTRRLDAAR